MDQKENGGFIFPREMELAKANLTARVENLEYNICPLCKYPMKESTANGIPVLACLPDRVVMPMKNIG